MLKTWKHNLNWSLWRIHVVFSNDNSQFLVVNSCQQNSCIYNKRVLWFEYHGDWSENLPFFRYSCCGLGGFILVLISVPCQSLSYCSAVVFPIIKAIPEGFSLTVHPSEDPLEQESVSLRCTADNYTHDQLQWYLLNLQALQDQQDKPQELDCRSVHLYAKLLQGQPSFQEQTNSWALNFSIESAQLQDKGHYVCRARSRRSGEKHCLFRYIFVRGEEKQGDESPWQRYTQHPTYIVTPAIVNYRGKLCPLQQNYTWVRAEELELRCRRITAQTHTQRDAHAAPCPHPFVWSQSKASANKWEVTKNSWYAPSKHLSQVAW